MQTPVDWSGGTYLQAAVGGRPILAVIGISGISGLIGTIGTIGTIGSGWLSDRFDNRWRLAWYCGLRGIALLWLVSTQPAMVGLTIFTVIVGLDFIATVPPSVRLTVVNLGRKMGPAVFAWIFAAHHVAAGVMAFGTGVGRDMLGTYEPNFMLAGVLCSYQRVHGSCTRIPAQARNLQAFQAPGLQRVPASKLGSTLGSGCGTAPTIC